MRVHHLALRSREPRRLEAFYATVLGLVVVRRDDERSVWLRMGDAVLMIERAQDDEPSPDPRSLELLAFAAHDAAERDAVEARLAAVGAAVEARTAYTIYFRDPEGRRVGVSTYPLFEAP